MTDTSKFVKVFHEKMCDRDVPQDIGAYFKTDIDDYDGACHAQLRDRLRINCSWVATSLWDGGTRKVYDEPRDCAAAFWDWICSTKETNPYRQLAPDLHYIYDPTDKFATGVYLDNAKGPANLTYSFMIATRMSHEQPKSIQLWYDLVSKYKIPEDHAYMIASMMRYKNDDGETLSYNVGCTHHVINPTLYSIYFRDANTERYVFNDRNTGVGTSSQIFRNKEKGVLINANDFLKGRRPGKFEGFFKNHYENSLRNNYMITNYSLSHFMDNNYTRVFKDYGRGEMKSAA